MAKIGQIDIEIGKRTGSASIRQLTSSPTHTDQWLKTGTPLPRSLEGREVFDAIAEALVGAEEGSGLDEILIEADGSVYNGFYDQLDFQIEELLYSIAYDIEDAISRQFAPSLNFSAADLELVSTGKFNETLTSQATTGLPSLLGSDEFKNLMSTLRDILPEYVGAALRWQVDTSELKKFLLAKIQRFSIQEVLPQVAQNICDAEVVISEHEQAPIANTLAGVHSHG